eukprot:TRINITY_DN958_c0_g1_i1.p1 TRINITY_DN958_c0_g1~~TRINITY_DN958_c0_g1_i1.p1  ORF type:complete len:156 (+),score=29.69 TRINITY_DN958_c0_g1_i1:15-482(+)
MRLLLLVATLALLCNTAFGACVCVGDDCGCCALIDITDPVKIDDEACVNITYVPADIGLDLTLTLGPYVLFNDSVSLEDPDICAAIPYLDELASLCLKFYNMNVTDKHVTGCVEVEVVLVEIDVADFQLGCFSFDIPEKSYLSAPDKKKNHIKVY